MPLIIQIRATSGAGKSTLMRDIIREYGASKIMVGDRVEAYQFGSSFILGDYSGPTSGGCDSAGSQEVVSDLVRHYAAKGNVLFEGLIHSGIFTRYDDLADELAGSGVKFIFGFLDTTVDVCLANNVRRRVAKQNQLTLDPAHLIRKYDAVLSTRRKLSIMGKDCRTIPYTLGWQTVTGWLQTEPSSCELQSTGPADSDQL